MTTFVSTLGFDTSHLQNLIVDKDIEDGDHILLVRPDDDDSRGENAVQDVKKNVDMLEIDLTTEVLRFDPHEFEETVITLVDRLSETDEAVVSLAGGDRALLVPLTVAAMSTSTEVRSVHLRSDVTRESSEIGLPQVCLALGDDDDRDILTYVVENGPVSNKQIAAMLGKSEATVHRRVMDLSELGYINVERNGAENSVDTTLLGKLAQNHM
jgi:CRISPR locus-related DNA-binding protein